MLQDPAKETTPAPPARSPSAWPPLLLPVLLLVLLIGVLVSRRWQPPEVETTGDRPGNQQQRQTWSPTPPPDGDSASLVIDFGNGARKRITALPWREGMTVRDLMDAAAAFRPGITFTHQGDGKTAFLTSIDGLQSEGPTARNWIYSVDGERGKESYGTRTVRAGDTVLWKFAPQE